MPKEAVDAFYEISPVHLAMSESELQKVVRPSIRLNQIRLAWWKEYDSAQSTMTRMTYKGVMSYLNGLPSLFLHNALRTPMHLAWILTPPSSYENTLEEALQRGLSRVNEILQLPFHDEDGRVSPKVIELVLKATMFIDVRLNGRPIEHIHQVNKTNLNISSGDAKKLGGTRIVQDLDEKIKSLEQQLSPEDYDKTTAEVTDG